MAVAALIGAMLGSYARHHWQHCARQVRVKSLLGCRGDGGDVTKMMEDDGRIPSFRSILEHAGAGNSEAGASQRGGSRALSNDEPKQIAKPLK